MEDNKFYLSTGIDHLDDLLSLGRENRKVTTGGIQLRKDNNNLSETPILLIEGVTGVGKTTLALQIAFNIARPKEKKDDTQEKKDDILGNWKVYLYSLEQSKEALMNNALNFGWIKTEKEAAFLDFSNDNNTNDEEAGPDMIRLCHFSPRPLEKEEDDFVFEQRKEELRHVLEKISENCKNGEEKYFPFFVIDSLTAFADRNLSRNEIYQLFQLFRDKNVPAILTVERYNIYTSDQDTISLECAKYLADIVIDLSTDTSNDYFKYRLEIIKSKVCRQALGKHLYKITTRESAPNKETENGIVIYPSLPYVLNNARDENPGNARDENPGYPVKYKPADFLICPNLVEKTNIGDLREEAIDELNKKTIDELKKEINVLKNRKNELFKIFNQTDIKPDSCIAIIGPTGTHKLALAINIAVSDMVNRGIEAITTSDTSEKHDGTQKKEAPAKDEAPVPVKNKVLILNFGSTNEFDFSGIAWTKQNEACSKIKKDPVETDQIKFWHDEYISEKDEVDDKVIPKMEVTVTTFRMGHLTAEECLDIIIKKIKSEKNNGGYSAAILNNTAKICTSFPELEKNFLFLPTLIEILSSNKIVSVCICVNAESGSSTESANHAILSKANYRMYLSHYPTIEKLSGRIVNRKIKEAKESTTIKEYIEEQLVSLVVDNVPGKNYIRAPKWLHIDNDTHPRILSCDENPIESLKKPIFQR